MNQHPRDTPINAAASERYSNASPSKEELQYLEEHAEPDRNISTLLRDFQIMWCWEEIAQLNTTIQLLQHQLEKVSV